MPGERPFESIAIVRMDRLRTRRHESLHLGVVRRHEFHDCCAAQLGDPVGNAREGNVAGNREVVNDGECGFLRPVGDVDSLAAAAVAILSDEAVGRRMGAAGRALAVGRFSEDATVARYRDLYERVLAGVSRA